MMKPAVLDIGQFNKQHESGDFYANIFSDHLTKNHHAISVPHKHNFYVTVLFTNGNGFHEIDFERFDVQRGSVFFLNPGQTHYWELSEDIEGLIFFHSESFYNLVFSQNTLSTYPFFYSTQNSPFLQLTEKQTTEATLQFQQILREYQSSEPWRSRKINNLVDGLYIEMSRIYLGQNPYIVHRVNSYSEKLKQLENLVNEYYKEEKSPLEYASKMNMSVKHLNRIVQNLIGKTTTALITERVVLEAKRMLSNPGHSLTEISEDLGFGEYAYFSRLFKKSTGKTPSEFRAGYQENQ